MMFLRGAGRQLQPAPTLVLQTARFWEQGSGACVQIIDDVRPSRRSRLRVCHTPHRHPGPPSLTQRGYVCRNLRLVPYESACITRNLASESWSDAKQPHQELTPARRSGPQDHGALHSRGKREKTCIFAAKCVVFARFRPVLRRFRVVLNNPSSTFGTL